MWQHGDQCNQPSLQFNVSHSSSLIACGITVDVPVLFIFLFLYQHKNFTLFLLTILESILWLMFLANVFFILMIQIGIDVEEKQRKTMSSISSLARRYFSPSEVEYLGSFSNTDAQQKEFIKLWTLKVSEILEGPFSTHLFFSSYFSL